MGTRKLINLPRQVQHFQSPWTSPPLSPQSKLASNPLFAPNGKLNGQTVRKLAKQKSTTLCSIKPNLLNSSNGPNYNSGGTYVQLRVTIIFFTILITWTHPSYLSAASAYKQMKNSTTLPATAHPYGGKATTFPLKIQTTSMTGQYTRSYNSRNIHPSTKPSSNPSTKSNSKLHDSLDNPDDPPPLSEASQSDISVMDVTSETDSSSDNDIIVDDPPDL